MRYKIKKLMSSLKQEANNYLELHRSISINLDLHEKHRYGS